MKKFTFAVQDENGMHARPAGRLATYAKRYTSQIFVKTDKKEVDCKRLLSLMSLGAQKGTVLTFCISGEDEEKACAEMERFCKEQWGNGVPINEYE